MIKAPSANSVSEPEIVELRMVLCCDRQHFERYRRCRDDLVGALWIDTLGPDVERCGEGKSECEHSLARS